MESVRHNIAEHGRIASVHLLTDCIIGLTHLDGYRYSFTPADLCEHGEITGVRPIGQGEAGIAIIFDDGHEHRLYFKGARSRGAHTPSIIPPLSEDRIRELAL